MDENYNNESPTEIVEKLFQYIITMKKKLLVKNVAKQDSTESQTLRNSVGKKIGIARKELNLSQEEFAKKIGMSRSRLAILETGEINRIDVLIKIALIVKKPIFWFFKDDEQQGGDLYRAVVSLQQQVAEMKEKFGK